MKEWLKPEFHAWIEDRVLTILTEHKEDHVKRNKPAELDEDDIMCLISPHASAEVWQKDLFYRLTKLSQWRAMDKALQDLTANHRIECTKFTRPGQEYTLKKGRDFRRFFAVLDVLDALVLAASDPSTELLLPDPTPKSTLDDLDAYAKRRSDKRMSMYTDAFRMWDIP
jgi:hypothetical protein